MENLNEVHLITNSTKVCINLSKNIIFHISNLCPVNIYTTKGKKLLGISSYGGEQIYVIVTDWHNNNIFLTNEIFVHNAMY